VSRKFGVARFTLKRIRSRMLKQLPITIPCRSPGASVRAAKTLRTLLGRAAELICINHVYSSPPRCSVVIYPRNTAAQERNSHGPAKPT